MSILGFFTRFTIIYLLAMGCLGIIAGILELEDASSINTPVLLGISFWCFYAYTNKNSRIVRGQEKWKLVFTALVGDILVSLILGIPTMLANEVPISFLFIGLLIVVPLHLVVFIVVNFGVKKYIIKHRPELVTSS